jgi:hypothetical protein
MTVLSRHSGGGYPLPSGKPEPYRSQKEDVIFFRVRDLDEYSRNSPSG